MQYTVFVYELIEVYLYSDHSIIPSVSQSNYIRFQKLFPYNSDMSNLKNTCKRFYLYTISMFIKDNYWCVLGEFYVAVFVSIF